MRPKALVLSLVPDTRELEELVWSLGYDVAGTIVQRRDRPDPATYVGRGKLDEAAERALDLGATLVAVNAALKPSQVFALERHFRKAKARRDRRARLLGEDALPPSGFDLPAEEVERVVAGDAMAGASEPRPTREARGGPDGPGRDRPDAAARQRSDAHARDVAAGRAPTAARHEHGAPREGAARSDTAGARDLPAAGRGGRPEAARPRTDIRGVANVGERGRDAREGRDGRRAGDRVRSEAAPARAGDEPIQVHDRLRLILDIFSERARSPEARLQVEYARLQYETPLVKEVIHLAKKGEHPGFLGGGRYEVNYYYMMMRSRMARIRRELDRISRERDVRRKHRRRGGFRLVSLAGYTNAGKSSLLEALAGAETVVENRYFSTLATTTRRAARGGFQFLLTDTVGFIEDLPPWMVEAFHSTLEEIALADCILLVVDASEPQPEIERKLRSSLRVLATVHARLRDGRGAGAGGARHAAGGDASRTATAPQAVDVPDEDAPAARAEVVDRAADAVGLGEAVTSDAVSMARAAAAAGVEGSGAPRAAEAAQGGGTAQPGTGDVALGAAEAALALRWHASIEAPLVLVLNKADLVEGDPGRVTAALRDAGLVPASTPCVVVSARTGAGLDELFRAVQGAMPSRRELRARLPASPATESLLAWLYLRGRVTIVRGNDVHVDALVDDRTWAEALARVHAAGGVVDGADEASEDASTEDDQDAESATTDPRRTSTP